METKKVTTFGISQFSETREVYKAPVIEMVEIQVEQGFQMSGAPFKSSNPLKEI